MDMRKKNTLDPITEWLANTYFKCYVKVFSTDEIKKEIKRHINFEIEKLLKQSNQEGPYVDLEYLFPYRKILGVSEAQLGKNEKAIITPVRGGFKIKIRPGLNFIDHRIAIAHEIGHTFLYDINKNIPYLPYPKTKFNYWIREGYAYEIARLILVPKESIKNFIKKEKLGISIKKLSYLSNIYKVSYDLLRKRLMDDLGLWDCLIFTSKLINKEYITVHPSYTSKGQRYKKISIPKEIKYNSLDNRYNELYHFLLSAFNYGYHKGNIKLKNKPFSIESKIKSYRDDTLLSIISNINTEGTVE